MVDPLVQELLEQAIDSPVKLQLLLLYHENPRFETTPRSIADRICRDIWSVGEALNQLAEDGILRRSATGQGDPIYRYAPVPEHVESIARLICGYDDPLERDKLQRSIRDVASYAKFRRNNSWEAQFA